MKSIPIILVPGFWLRAWAWDEVVTILRNAGHDVTPLTLPGPWSSSTVEPADRSTQSLVEPKGNQGYWFGDVEQVA